MFKINMESTKELLIFIYNIKWMLVLLLCVIGIALSPIYLEKREMEELGVDCKLPLIKYNIEYVGEASKNSDTAIFLPIEMVYVDPKSSKSIYFNFRDFGSEQWKSEILLNFWKDEDYLLHSNSGRRLTCTTYKESYRYAKYFGYRSAAIVYMRPKNIELLLTPNVHHYRFSLIITEVTDKEMRGYYERKYSGPATDRGEIILSQE